MGVAFKFIRAMAIVISLSAVLSCQTVPPPPLPPPPPREIPYVPLTSELFERIMQNESVLRVQYYLSEELILERDKLLRRVDVTFNGEVIEYDNPSREVVRIGKHVKGELIELLPAPNKGWILKISFDYHHESPTLSFLLDNRNPFCRLEYVENRTSKTVVYGSSDRPFTVTAPIFEPHLLIKYEARTSNRTPTTDIVMGRSLAGRPLPQ